MGVLLSTLLAMMAETDLHGEDPEPPGSYSGGEYGYFGVGGYCAVLSTGGVDCWGLDNLGNGTTEGSDLPVAVSSQ